MTRSEARKVLNRGTTIMQRWRDPQLNAEYEEAQRVAREFGETLVWRFALLVLFVSLGAFVFR